MKQEYTITRVSPFSRKSNDMTMSFDYEDYQKWEAGTSIQHAMPYLTPDEREFLMTGITPAEWAETFNKDD